MQPRLSVVIVLFLVSLIVMYGLFVWPIGLDKAIEVIGKAPRISLLASVSLFATVCLANWHKGFRKKVNYYLSGGREDEQAAYAGAEETLYTLNVILLAAAAIIAIFSLGYLGL